MSEQKSGVAGAVAVLKDLVAALRDAVLVIVFVLMVFVPAQIKDSLEKAGFTRGSILGFDWEAEFKSAAEQTKAVGQTVSQAKDSYAELMARLSEIERRVSEPKLKESIRDLRQTATTTAGELTEADQAARDSLSTQQEIVARIEPTTVPLSGWIYLGKVSEEKSAWDPGVQQTVRSPPWPLERGVQLRISDDVYLRDDSNLGARSTAPILGVLQLGEPVQVVEVDYSHARGGGWFVWAKVRRVQPR